MVIYFDKLRKDFNRMHEDKIRQIEEDKRTMYLIVAGSRQFTPYGTMEVTLKDGSTIYVENHSFIEDGIKTILSKRIADGFSICIVSGEAKGVDETAKIIAERNNWKYIGFPADWETNGNRAGILRNNTMYQFVASKPHKGSLLVWDGESRGTANNFVYAYEYDIPIRCYNFMKCLWLKQSEIRNIQEIELTKTYWYNK